MVYNTDFEGISLGKGFRLDKYKFCNKVCVLGDINLTFQFYQFYQFDKSNIFLVLGKFLILNFFSKKVWERIAKNS